LMPVEVSFCELEQVLARDLASSSSEAQIEVCLVVPGALH
jgi:hypothetical protein